MSTHPALDTATTALQAAARVAAAGWDDVDDTDLLALADTLARLKSVTDAALVGLAGRLEDTGAADKAGWASAKDFLTHLLGGHKGAGGSYTRAAARTRDLPQVRQALATGEISLAQAA